MKIVKMMKNKRIKIIVLAASLALTFTCSIDAQMLSDLKGEDLLGAVHMVKEERIFFVKTGETWRELPRVIVSTTTYNLKGMTIESNLYKTDDSLASKVIFEYDEKGNRIAVKMYNPDGSLNRTEVYTNNERGNPTQIQLIKTDGTLINDATIRYNDKGKRVKSFHTTPEINPEVKTKNIYDERGRVKEIHHIKAGVLDHKDVISYNDRGIRNELASYNAEGNLLFKDTWIFDDSRKLLEHSHESADGYVRDITVYSYQIDSQGNWLECVVEAKNKSGEIIFKQIRHRTIVYYP